MREVTKQMWLEGADVCRSARSQVLCRSARGRKLRFPRSCSSKFPIFASQVSVLFVAIVVVTPGVPYDRIIPRSSSNIPPLRTAVSCPRFCARGRCCCGLGCSIIHKGWIVDKRGSRALTEFGTPEIGDSQPSVFQSTLLQLQVSTEQPRRSEVDRELERSEGRTVMSTPKSREINALV